MTKKLEEKCMARFGLGEETIISFYDFGIDSKNEGMQGEIGQPDVELTSL